MKMANFLLQFSILLSLLLLSFRTHPATALSSANKTDKLALLAIRGRITQDIHGIMNSWNESLHFCDWMGVTCSRRHKGRVTLLSLERCGLVGSIPPQIGNLSFLRGINLAENIFQGEIPSEIGRLFRLRFLNLSDNALQGEIPGNLNFCSSLEVVKLSLNMLVGKIPNSLQTLGMEKLNILFLESNKLTGTIPKWLGNASSLVQLSLSSNKLHGSIPVELGKLPNLSFLRVSANNLSGVVPPAIYNLSSLIFLSLAVNQLHGQIPNDISLTLPNLLVILCGNNYFTGPLPVSLSNASQLKVIAFEANNFSGPVPPNLGRLNDLKTLILAENQLENKEGDDFGLASLTNCSKLIALDLGGNLFKGHLPTSIVNVSSRLEILSIEKNQISGRLPDGIGNLIGLTYLTFGSNFLTGEIPNSIGRLEKLNKLLLSDNQLSGTIPSSIVNLTQLLYLYLEGNNLEGEIPFNLGNCRNLLEVNLSYNNITGSIAKEVISSTIISLDFSGNFLSGLLPLELGKMTNIINLVLSHNRLSGEIPSTLGNCPMMEDLYLQDNLFIGSIPSSFSALKSLQNLDLSKNNLSGQIPKYFQNLTLLQYLNLSFNKFEGEVPYEGVFGNASAISVVGNQDLCGGIQKLGLPPCKIQGLKKNKRSHNLKIVIPIVSCSILLAVFLFLFLIFFTWARTSKRKASSMLQTQESFPKISYVELSQATNDFSSANLIGEGGFGPVYKGIMGENGMLVAVKVLNLEQKGASKSFVAECEAMRNIRHRNLIKVLTVCSSIDFKGVDFKAIVYEFMQNGNLDEWLHSNEVQVGVRNFSFIKRLNVAIEVAHAIEYLHYHCQPAIVHGDLKPSNILLDHELVAHVGDFGLARFLISSKKTSSLGVIGTIGYVAPEYGTGREASMAGDVFSFGILLLEMITGKRPTDEIFKDGLNLHQFAKLALPEHVMDIVDASLLQEVQNIDENVGNIRRSTRERTLSIKETLITFARIGVLCSMESPNDRLEMNDVAAELCGIRDKFLGNYRFR